MLAGGNSWRIVETPTMQKVIRAKGYDAIRSMDEGVECLAVLAPNQLKAAGKYLYSERNTGAFSPDIDDIRFRQVYHGSPASFEHFDRAFTGTGEGAQAYGWGTYVTEVDAIAKRYAAIGIKRGNHITYDGEPLSSVLDNEYYFDGVWRVWKRQILSSTDVDSLKRNISSVYMDGRAAGTYSRRRKAFEQQKRICFPTSMPAGYALNCHATFIQWKFRKATGRTTCDGSLRYRRNSKDKYSCNCEKSIYFSPVLQAILEWQVPCMEQWQGVLWLSGLYVHRFGNGH